MKRTLLFLLTLISSFWTYADAVEDPCSGPTALLNLVNRPTNAVSACVVPVKKLLIESGFQYQKLLNSNGRLYNLPNVTMRLGLPAKNELIAILPNYTHQSQPPTHGSTVTAIGLKHQLGHNDKWVIATSGYITALNGSASFGSAGTEMAISGIMNYSINKKLSITGVLSGLTQTQPVLNGGKRYSSANPDLLLSYTIGDKLNLFVEIYAQSQTGPEQGWGSVSDFGILYLLTSTVVIDIEVAKRIQGEIGGFDRYIGAGISVLLG